MKNIFAALLSVASLVGASTVHATVYRLDFTASEFVGYRPAPAPEDVVSGSIVFQAESLDAPVTSIDAIDLTISGHVYSLTEIGYRDYGYLFFGGIVGTLSRVYSGTDDFWLAMTEDGGFRNFTYSTALTNSVFQSNTGTATVTELVAAVPEPGSLALILAGMGGLGVTLRRRRR